MKEFNHTTARIVFRLSYKNTLCQIRFELSFVFLSAHKRIFVFIYASNVLCFHGAQISQNVLMLPAIVQLQLGWERNRFYSTTLLISTFIQRRW